MIVADTCLVFHLFNKATFTNEAQQILEKDPVWILPSLWREEYANVLSKLARKEKRPVSEVIDLLSYTIQELEHSEMTVDTRKALEISLEYKISVYDAHFIVLAIENQAFLVTEDKEVLKNCPKLARDFRAFLRK